MERIIYLANMRMPTERAHGIQVAKTCEAAAKAGAEVTLVVPARKTAIKEDAFAYYGIQRNFKVIRLPVLDVMKFGKPGFLIESITFGISAAIYCLMHRKETAYSRDELPLWIVGLFIRKCVWESHTGSINFFARRLLKRGRKCVVISNGLKEFYERKGFQAAFLVAHDAVDPAPFSAFQPGDASREKLGFSQNEKIVMYAGKLDGWKGAVTLFEAASRLPHEYRVVIIGGEESRIKELSAAYPKVSFLGQKPYRDLPAYTAIADVLVVPNTAKDTVSAHYTSPMKLFAYMAAGRPIVASNLPSLREILNEENAVLFEADKPDALAAAIVKAGQPEALPLGVQAKKDVVAYTWNSRARAILDFLR